MMSSSEHFDGIMKCGMTKIIAASIWVLNVGKSGNLSCTHTKISASRYGGLTAALSFISKN